ncbi:tail fiber domain-containing protein [uncultured Bacteroides sp.]|uniref:tail fiber domain-containing protein n=1 Tax=uncultured Bacteroides sp. TaxID=162156 RepID=UPI002AA955C9|nr:tail fiber domain-containing protein [uncultured Bacteroides sp.]
MSQLKIKNSTNSSAPAATGITAGELAICTLSGSEKLYTKNSAGTVVNLLDWSKIGSKPTTLSGYGITNTITDINSNYSGKIYDIPCRSIFSGNNLVDAPTTGWVSGLVLGDNWNSNHFQRYLVFGGNEIYYGNNGNPTTWYKLWDSGNSNLSNVDWTANNGYFNGSSLSVEGTSGNRYLWSKTGAQKIGFWTGGDSAIAASSDIVFKTGHQFDGSTFGVEKMRLTASGNLLINKNTDDGYKLDVAGTGRFNGTLIANAFNFSTVDDVSSINTGTHNVEFGGTGYVHKNYYFRPSYSTAGPTVSSLYIQNVSADSTPVFTTTHSFTDDGSASHSGNLNVGGTGRFAGTLTVDDFAKFNGELYTQKNICLQNSNNDIYTNTGPINLIKYSSAWGTKSRITLEDSNINITTPTINNTITSVDNNSFVGFALNSSNTINTNGANFIKITNNGSEILKYTRKYNGQDTYDLIMAPWSSIQASNRLDFYSSNDIFLNSTHVNSQGAFNCARIGDASSTATQKDSYPIMFQNSMWNGTSTNLLYNTIKSIASTTTNLNSRLAFLFNTDSCGNGGTEVMNLSCTGVMVNSNITATGEVTAYSASDKRLKKNIKPIESGLEVIDKLNPVTYNWNSTAKELNSNKTDVIDVGLIAQEVEKVLPEIVHPIYANYKSIDYIKLIPYLISAIKEQQEEINILKNKIK